MGKVIKIKGVRVLTESAEPPLRMLTPTRWYAWLEGVEDVVGNGSSRASAIQNLRDQIDSTPHQGQES